jgi:hypothetical protein
MSDLSYNHNRSFLFKFHQFYKVPIKLKQISFKKVPIKLKQISFKFDT